MSKRVKKREKNLYTGEETDVVDAFDVVAVVDVDGHEFDGELLTRQYDDDDDDEDVLLSLIASTAAVAWLLS